MDAYISFLRPPTRNCTHLRQDFCLKAPTTVHPINSFHSVYVRKKKKLNIDFKRSLKIRAKIDFKPWDFGRFMQTLFFFNEPPSPLQLLQSLISQMPSSNSNESSVNKENVDHVLVVGATGGVGKRVVDVLRRKNIPVRALVRNIDKAKALLGPDVDLIVGDVTKQETLKAEYFEGVRRVINAVSVIVGPKEGDTLDREKYRQGIKFFEPEIKGAPPELVEYAGMQNLIKSVKDKVGLRDGKLLFGFQDDMPLGPVWGSLDDVVMGGVSASSFEMKTSGGEEARPTGCFKGNVSTANNGGFASIRTKNFSSVEDLSAYDGLEIRLKGDGNCYKFIIRTTMEWDAVGYTTTFDTIKDKWQTVRLPFSSFIPVFRARVVKDSPPFNPRQVASLQLMYSKFEYDGKLNPTFKAGSFELPFSSIKTYLKEPITPRFVHVSSAGVTRPERPGLDLSKQPPAVRLNKELGNILTFKLKGEDSLRDSGIPYTIIRPCALTEEPAGAELIFDQGDNIMGKISRDEIANICVAALESAYACDTTFEVKSDVPFNETFTVDPNNPPPEKNYEPYFQSLKKGITGKEALQRSVAIA